MSAKYVIAGLVLLIALAGLLWTKPIESHVKASLLLSQELPQVPLKPLHLLTSAPVHQELQLDSAHGRIAADLFIPTSRFGSTRPDARPAIILAMGIKTNPKDRPRILGLADTLSRLGYVVLWPRLQALDEGVPLAEEPETFVTSFQYLRESDLAAEDRISILGFSIGSSTGFVAAADPRIAADVRALVFFGGYYDVFDYVVSLATHTSAFHGQEIAWHPSDEAVGHLNEVLEARDARGIIEVFSASTPEEADDLLKSAPAHEIAELRRMSPSTWVSSFRATIFILHDKADPFVPYLESAKLDQALTDVEKTYLIIELFEHVQPKEGVSRGTVMESIKLYGFLYEVLSHL
jgi:hypothetical protein